jgi:hypothetical protein
MPGPRKVDYSDRILEVTQTNFEFLLTKLWGPDAEAKALRDELITAESEAQLRASLARLNIEVLPGTKLMVVDIVGARTKSFVTSPGTEDFYVLVLPPKPRRHPGNDRYKEMQGWMAAHYHAVNDSYGM